MEIYVICQKSKRQDKDFLFSFRPYHVINQMKHQTAIFVFYEAEFRTRDIIKNNEVHDKVTEVSTVQ